MEFMEKLPTNYIKTIFENIDRLKEILLEEKNEDLITYFQDQLYFVEKRLEEIYIIPE